MHLITGCAEASEFSHFLLPGFDVPVFIEFSNDQDRAFVIILRIHIGRRSNTCTDDAVDISVGIIFFSDTAPGLRLGR
jgi:hypothetical protein